LRFFKSTLSSTDDDYNNNVEKYVQLCHVCVITDSRVTVMT